ncbi:MAG TPA: integrase family protein [Pseudolabrys sp.]|nr:integrase family protein [Pseudolabrys sp.]
MRRTLTDNGVDALKPRSKGYAFPDPQLVGHYVRVWPTGARAFTVVARDPYGKQIWHTIGNCDALKIEDAREIARDARKRIKQGLAPVEAPPVKPDTYKDVAENWLRRHVAAKKLRSAYEMRRSLEKYVYPKWQDRPFVSIKRSDVANLLDHVEDNHGSRMADLVLSFIRAIANWYASRDDEYTSPFVRNMRRHLKPARSRILNDDELRTIWKHAEANGQFGGIIQLLLLTGQRREKVVEMKWDDIADGVWTIATADREKGNGGALALPPLALAIVDGQPRVGSNPFVFPGRGSSHFKRFPHSVADFNAKLPKMPRWTLHDLRRTSRSLLSRAGIAHELAERIIGHTVGTAISQVYDRHRYHDEKKRALAKLAALIDAIVNERRNVIPLANQTRRRK